MTAQGHGSSKRSPGVKAFISQLVPEEKTLLVIRKELYDGSWKDMLDDLRSRLQGKPFTGYVPGDIESINPGVG